MAQEEVLRIHINPDNRGVSINDTDYQKAWVKAFERTRLECEEEIRAKVEAGELEISVDPTDPKTDTFESTIRYMAHSNTEITMQNWAVERGIGMVGVSGGQDHGRLIEYIDDPEVPFMDFEIEKAA